MPTTTPPEQARSPPSPRALEHAQALNAPGSTASLPLLAGSSTTEPSRRRCSDCSVCVNPEVARIPPSPASSVVMHRQRRRRRDARALFRFVLGGSAGLDRGPSCSPCRCGRRRHGYPRLQRAGELPQRVSTGVTRRPARIARLPGYRIPPEGQSRSRVPGLVLLNTDAEAAAGFLNPCASSTRVGGPRDGRRLSCCHDTRLVLPAAPVSLPSRCAPWITWRPAGGK